MNKHHSGLREPLVISFGGNALVKGSDRRSQSSAGQQEASIPACDLAAELFHGGIHQLVLTHGNGPQVGFEALRNNAGKEMLEEDPLDVLGAKTQGQIAYMFERQIRRFLADRSSVHQKIASLFCMVRVDENDPELHEFTKPIGPWYSDLEAEEATSLHPEWVIRRIGNGKDKGEGRHLRRVVPSPSPVEVINAELIKDLVHLRYLTICGGGGGIPVIKTEKGLIGVEAVIDKDRTTALIATVINASLLAILTAAQGVADPVEWEKHGEEAPIIPEITLDEGRDILSQLKAGSMRPKLEACLSFVENTGSSAIITDFAHASNAIYFNGVGGTKIIPSRNVADGHRVIIV